jgi:hypothetical protein
MPRRLSIEDKVNTLLYRLDHSYEETLSTFEITPTQFCRIVTRDLHQLKSANGLTALEDPNKVAELFIMSKDFLTKQYDRLMGRITGERQSRFYEGTFKHQSNVDFLIWHILTYNHPDLKSSNRKTLASAIKKMPHNLKRYFFKIGMNGILCKCFSKGELGSPLAAIRRYDVQHQITAGINTLFDLKEKYHIHPWGEKNMSAPNGYWKKAENVNSAIYHLLTEQHPDLTSENPETVASTLNGLPDCAQGNLQDYFYDIGMRGLMNKGFCKGETGSPKAVIRRFDLVYRKKTGNGTIIPYLNRALKG